MDELSEFGRIVLGVSLGLSLAIAGRSLADRVRIPTAALLLVASSAASDIFPSLGNQLSIDDVQRIATVALIVILFEGGAHIGWRRFSRAATPILSLGILGTFATAGLVALAAHELLDVSWTVAGLLGAALAPTDPAVTFSVLAGRELRGRSGTIIEGESGFNDPVGIALMVGMVEYATVGSSLGEVGTQFLRELAIGAGLGVVGGLALLWFMRRLHLPDPGLYPLRVLALSGIIYGTTTLLDGSGFLAVFVAGIVVGDAAVPHKREIRRFYSSLGNLAEIAVFIALGLTIDLTFIADEGLWIDGLVLAALLAFVIRPVCIGVLLLPIKLTRGERLFVMWSGLKGAVPILLASLAVVAQTEAADRIYAIVFVVVLFSVLVQGTAVPTVAKLLRVRKSEPRRQRQHTGDVRSHRDRDSGEIV